MPTVEEIQQVLAALRTRNGVSQTEALLEILALTEGNQAHVTTYNDLALRWKRSENWVRYVLQKSGKFLLIKFAKEGKNLVLTRGDNSGKDSSRNSQKSAQKSRNPPSIYRSIVDDRIRNQSEDSGSGISEIKRIQGVSSKPLNSLESPLTNPNRLTPPPALLPPKPEKADYLGSEPTSLDDPLPPDLIALFESQGKMQVSPNQNVYLTEGEYEDLRTKAKFTDGEIVWAAAKLHEESNSTVQSKYTGFLPAWKYFRKQRNHAALLAKKIQNMRRSYEWEVRANPKEERWVRKREVA